MPKASVKIMLSHDYCHFEVCLGSDEDLSLKQIDDLRKEAQRLADKAVKQYQIAKEKMSRFLELNDIFSGDSARVVMIREELNRARETPESERTPQQKGQLKAYADWEWMREHQYDYEDEFVNLIGILNLNVLEKVLQ